MTNQAEQTYQENQELADEFVNSWIEDSGAEFEIEDYSFDPSTGNHNYFNSTNLMIIVDRNFNVLIDTVE